MAKHALLFLTIPSSFPLLAPSLACGICLAAWRVVTGKGGISVSGGNSRSLYGSVEPNPQAILEVGACP